MKVLLISVYNGSVNRGVESWCNQLLKYLINSNVDAKLIQGGETVPSWIASKDRIVVQKCNIEDTSGDTGFISRVQRRLGIYKTDVQIRRFYKEIEKEIVSFKPDILLPVNGEIKAMRNIVLRNKLNCKLVVVGHAGVPAQVKFADCFIALSERDKQQIDSSQSKMDTFLVNNGVDVELFSRQRVKSSIREMYGSFGKPLVLSVSALVPYKRLELAIKSVNKINDASLIMIGSGPEKEKLLGLIEAIVPEERRSSFQILEKVNFEDMPSYYELADVFVHPADHTEAFGSVIIESMAMGTPVVVNNDSVRRDIVGPAGYLVNPADENDLAQAILNAYKHKNNNEYEELCLKQASKYSWTEVGKCYFNIFNGLLNYAD